MFSARIPVGRTLIFLMLFLASALLFWVARCPGRSDHGLYRRLFYGNGPDSGSDGAATHRNRPEYRGDQTGSRSLDLSWKQMEK